MADFLEMVQAAERTLTVMFSGYNTLYFIRYRAPTRARRVAALVLALVNLAILGHALQFILFRYLTPKPFSYPGLGAVLEAIPLAAAFMVTILVLRHRMNHPFDKE